jgi:hypothetical protein
MATRRAVEATCNAVVELLRDAYVPADFDEDLEFRTYTAANFPQHMVAGVSLFLYRVFINGTQRIPGGRYMADGTRRQTQLPLDAHFLLTAWGRDASMQHTICGWLMRTIEDTPVLPSGLLNRRTPGIFHPDEAVEIVPGELATEDLTRLWELIGPSSYQLSIPYIARNVRIESELPLGGELVQERVAHYATEAARP